MEELRRKGCLLQADWFLAGKRHGVCRRSKITSSSVLISVLFCCMVSPVFGQVIYVDVDAKGSVHDGSSWCDAFMDLQDALDLSAASPGMPFEIRVAGGTYKPDRGTGDASMTFQIVSNITLQGGYAGCGATDPSARDVNLYETTLSGDLNGDDDLKDCSDYSNCCFERVLGQSFGCDNAACEQIVCDLRPECCDANAGLGPGWSQICYIWAKRHCCEFGARCDNTARIVTASDANANVRIDGFTLAHAYTLGSPLTTSPGGAMNIGGGTVMVSNCIFRNNTNAGVMLYDAQATFDHCVFRETTGGSAIDVGRNGRSAINNCVFEHNDDSHAVDSFGGGSMTVKGSTFRHNAGGGISVSGSDANDITYLRGNRFFQNGNTALRVSGNALITQCDFVNNVGGLAAGVHASFANAAFANCSFIGNRGTALRVNNSGLSLTGCVFVGNRTWKGGSAINGHTYNLALDNCTVAYNTGEIHGSGIALDNASMTMRNSIIWGNRTELNPDDTIQISTFDATLTLFNSIVEDWTPALGGTGNSAADPQFVDPWGPDGFLGTEDDDLHLSTKSPAIDAGDSGLLTPDFTDLDQDGNTTEPVPIDIDGAARISGLTIDIGAYEGGKPSYIVQGSPLQVAEKSSAAFSVSLVDKPAEPVQVKVTTPGTDRRIQLLCRNAISVDDTSCRLSFDATNYSTPQSVTVTAFKDKNLLNETAVVWLSADGLPLTTIPVTVFDVDPVPAILYVNDDAIGLNLGTGWDDALTTLQDAIDIAGDRGDVSEIWVAEGRYTPSRRTFYWEPRSVTFSLVNGVGFYGGFSGDETCRDERDPRQHPTILSGDINNNDLPGDLNLTDNSYSVVSALNVDSTTVLNGFIVRDGNAVGFMTTQSLSSVRGGGLMVLSGNPTISSCIFEHNHGEKGGGVYVRDASPSFDGCIVRGNRSIENSAIGTLRSPMRVTNSAFIGNQDSGVAGAAVLGDEFLEFRNCTVVGNTAQPHGGPAAIVAIDGEIQNSVFWANVKGGKIDEYTQLATKPATIVNNSCIQGWTRWNQGTGNTDQNPMFVDMLGPDGILGTADDDLRLAPGSPAINRGFPGFMAGANEKDVEGKERVQGCVVDMGAYEANVTPSAGDFDASGIVDLRDFADFQLCQSAIGADPGLAATCRCVFDDNNDLTIDVADLVSFINSINQP